MPALLQALFQFLAQFHVFVEQIGILAVGIPARFPGLVVAEAKPVRVCFLSHYFFPLLSAGSLLPGQRLANAASGATNALLGFRFGNVGGNAFGGGHVMLCNAHPNMRGALLVSERTAHRRGTQDASSARLRSRNTCSRRADRHRAASRNLRPCARRWRWRCAALFQCAWRRAWACSAATATHPEPFCPRIKSITRRDFLRRHAHVARNRVSFNRTGLCLYVSHCLMPSALAPLLLAPAPPLLPGAAPRGLLESCLDGVALERARRRKLSQLVPDHLFGHIHGNEFLSVVHGDRVADHVRHDRGAPRPRLQNFLFVARVQSIDLFAQVAIHKRPLLR